MEPVNSQKSIAAMAVNTVLSRGTLPVTMEDVARACYDANLTYSRAIGDGMERSWEDSAESVTNGVKFRLANPSSSPADNHANWLVDKAAAGWKYGPVKDDEKKEHPCFLPYEQLPEEQRAKDIIFAEVVRGLTPYMQRTLYAADRPDARLADAPKLAEEHRLFRKRYRQLSQDEIALHDAIKDKADELAALFYRISPVHTSPDSNRERGANVALGIRHLEDAVYRAVKGLTS